VQAPSADGVEATAVSLDGKVHNWAEQADGATFPAEALQTVYRKDEPAFVARTDGPFALAIVGPRGLLLARDPVGKSTLYYGLHQRAACFATEV
jgi:asparagine synthetase B (glutamine-hydrolysing)